MLLARKRRKVVLHGHLGTQFGKEHMLAVKSPGEAIRLFEANFPKRFSKAIEEGRYSIVVGENEWQFGCNEQFINFQFPEGTIHIIPEMSGHDNKGLWTLIAGISILAIAFTGGLSAVGFFAEGAAMGFGAAASAGLGTTIFAGVTWGQVALFGAALALSGVSMLLTPTVKADQNEQTDDSKTQSYFFNGAVNIVKEGVCVPLVYGRVIAGSVVVYASLTSENLDGYTSHTVVNTLGAGLITALRSPQAEGNTPTRADIILAAQGPLGDLF